MSHDASFAISFAPGLPDADQQALLAVLRANGEVQQPAQKGLDWATFVVIMEQAGKVAGGAVALAKLAEQIYTWAQAARKRGAVPRARLERPGQPPLDIASASQEQILAWLLAGEPHP
jgi:hypothetical protein